MSILNSGFRPPAPAPGGGGGGFARVGRSLWLAYGVAVPAPLAIVLLRLSVGYEIGDPPSLVLFTIPIMLCAYLGGLGPGLVCTLVSLAVTSYYLLPPFYRASIEAELLTVQWVGLAVIGAFISVLSEGLHRARQRTEDERNRLAVTLASIGDAVIATDRGGAVTALNLAAERLTGWSAAQGQGQPLAEVLHIIDEGTRQAVADPIETVLRRGEAVELSGSMLLVARDGREIPVEDSAAPIKCGDGAFLGAVLTFRDCSAKRQASAALKRSEGRLRAIIDTEPECVKVVDDRGHLLEMNLAGLRMLEAASVAEVRARPLHSYVLPAHREGFLGLHARVMGGESGKLQFEVEGLRGTRRWLETHATPLRDEEGAIYALLGVTRDVTEYKRAERHIQHLNRLYATLSETNQVIVRAESEEELFPAITRIAVDFGGLVCAWIGLLDEQTRRLRPLSVHGPAAAYAQNLEISSDPSLPEGQGPGGVVLREGRPQLCNDFLNDPRTAPFHAAAEALGIRSSAGFPLRREGRVIGVLSLYAGETDFFVEDLGQLLEEMAVDISFALDNFAHQRQRREAEQALRQSELRLRLAVAASGHGIYDVNLQTGERTVSAEYAAMLGYEPGEFHEDTDAFLERLHPKDRNAWLSAYSAWLAGTAAEFRCEFRMRTAGGDWKWILAMGGAVERDENGKPLRFIGTHTDISERKAHEDRMRLSASVFESSHEAIVITDAALTIVSVNLAFTKVTGYSSEEVLGRHVRLLHSGHHDKAFYREIWRQIEQRGHWQGELWDRRKDGTTYPTLAAISAVRNEAGAVTHYVNISADITQNKHAEERIQQLAYYDVLTGVPNRVLLQDRANRALAQAHREETGLALLFVDIDRFKTINDTLGHSVGDALLQAMAERLQRSVRDSDTVSRLGGDEFLLLVFSETRDGAARLARKLLSTISEPCEINGQSLRITASIGISVFPKDGSTFEDLLKHADIAMYKAKDSGRDTFHFFTSEMNAGALERLALENALRRSLGQRQMMLHYQPQVRLADGAIVGFEALIRWCHPEQGMIAPATFIPIAEESGLIASIGAWVLQEACRQNRAWQAAGAPALPVSVNVSIRQFSLGSVLQVVADALRDSGLAPDCLELEITEGVMVQDVGETLSVLRRLKARGVRVAVDDFGTGYSSLSYIKRFPLNRLKIDQSFVRELVSSRDDQAIASAIINLGHSLGLRVIAEGVESEAQLELLRSLGCDEAQGYLFGKPMPAEDFAPYLYGRAALGPPSVSN